MEPATQILSRQSTKSYLERELIVSLDDNGPMIGPSLELMNTHLEEDEEQVVEESHTHSKEKHWWDPRPSTKKAPCICDPKSYSAIKKNTILFLVAVGGAIAPISYTIYYPALVDMQNDFNTTDTVMNASLSVFTFVAAFFPLVWATFGDLFGRRKIYIISFFISVVGSICCAVSVNAQMFIAFRAISAIGSSSAMSMGAGTISDIFEPHERGRAFVYYTCGPLLGPAFGPIIGGYLNQGLGWRSDFWFLAIFCFLNWVGIIFFLPETWRATPTTAANNVVVPMKNPDQKVNDTTEETKSITTSCKSTTTTCKSTASCKSNSSSTIHQQENGLESVGKHNEKVEKKTTKFHFVNPVGALKLLLYPNIALAVIFAGALFFVVYLNSTNFTRIYTLQYGLSSGIVGVCYLPSAIGSMIGGIVGGKMSDKIYNQRVAKAKAEEQEIYPEMRLGGPLFYASIILQLFAFTAYGWCMEKDVHFAFGLVCQFFTGFSLMLPNVAVSTYMVDCFRKKSASVTACNNFARYIMAGIGSLVASELLRALGSGILFTLCGCFILVASMSLIIIRLYTKKMGITQK